MPSKNSSSRGNQQERLKIIGWIVGFVDGEGCFTISLHKNPTTSSGWQIMPEFIVTQGEKSEHLHLEGVRKIIKIIETMNTRKRRPFFLESSETIR